MALKFYKQQHPSTCGIAVFRTMLGNKFNLHKTELSLIRLAETLYKKKYHPKAKNEDYKIKKEGTSVTHFASIAKYFGFRAFSKSWGTIRELKYLLYRGVFPIIHRPFVLDNDGHYLMVTGYTKTHIILFDPARGTPNLKEETYKEFYKKWYFPQMDERWFIFFYYEGDLKISFRGKHL